MTSTIYLNNAFTNSQLVQAVTEGVKKCFEDKLIPVELAYSIKSLDKAPTQKDFDDDKELIIEYVKKTKVEYEFYTLFLSSYTYDGLHNMFPSLLSNLIYRNHRGLELYPEDITKEKQTLSNTTCIYNSESSFGEFMKLTSEEERKLIVKSTLEILNKVYTNCEQEGTLYKFSFKE